MGADRTAKAYEAVADAYEARFADELAGKPRDRDLLDALALALDRDGVVLDVGCGPGQIGAHLRRRGGGRSVVGVDLSLGMARLAAARLSGAVVADMRALPIRTASVGDVVAFYSVIHLERSDLGGVFIEFARVLQPGAHVLVSAHEGQGEVEVTEFLGHEVTLAATFFTLDELVGAAVAAGLEVVTAERRPPYENEGTTVRLYVEAALPLCAPVRPQSE